MGSEIAFWYVRERSLLGCGGAIAVGECGEWAIVLIMRVLEGRSLLGCESAIALIVRVLVRSL
ncbi:MAG: hypothetical protein ACOYN8_01970 [Pseudanabaena sp.]|jgi:hypothetical protein